MSRHHFLDPRVMIVGAFAVLAIMCSAACAEDRPDRIRVLMLGDSITKGERAGVLANETFASLVEIALRGAGIQASVENAGIGGERTDQALARLETALGKSPPKVVVVMYGTNDSYVDPGRDKSRLTAEEYGANLRTLLSRLQAAGAKPILMTPPRWGADAAVGGDRAHPNQHVAEFAEVCREVAKELKVPLVDHFAFWTKAEAQGRDLSDWTTDECHPNPAGHRVMADLITPALAKTLRESP